MYFAVYSKNVISQEIRDNGVNYTVWITGCHLLQMEDYGIPLRSVVKRRNNAGRSKCCICLNCIKAFSHKRLSALQLNVTKLCSKMTNRF